MGRKNKKPRTKRGKTKPMTTENKITIAQMIFEVVKWLTELVLQLIG